MKLFTNLYLEAHIVFEINELNSFADILDAAIIRPFEEFDVNPF
jgi:hypothetical protein